MNRGAQWLATTLMPWMADLPPGQPINMIDAMLHPCLLYTSRCV